MTWSSSGLSATNFVSVTSSSVGDIVYAACGGGVGSVFSTGYIYKSLDYGVTWNVTNSLKLEWTRVSCDETGQYVTASVFQGQI